MYTTKKNLIQLLQTFFFLADLMKSGKALKGLQERSGKGKRNMKKVNAIEKVLSITLQLLRKESVRKILPLCLLDYKLLLQQLVDRLSKSHLIERIKRSFLQLFMFFHKFNFAVGACLILSFMILHTKQNTLTVFTGLYRPRWGRGWNSTCSNKSIRKNKS